MGDARCDDGRWATSCRKGAISEAQLAEAIEQLKKLPGKRLGEYLISIGAVSQEAVAEALAI